MYITQTYFLNNSDKYKSKKQQRFFSGPVQDRCFFSENAISMEIEIRKRYDVSNCRSCSEISVWELIVISLFRGLGKNDVGAVKRNARPSQTAEWAINDRMPHADEPLFSSNRHCNMKHTGNCPIKSLYASLLVSCKRSLSAF